MTNLGQAVNIVKSLILQGSWVFGEGHAEEDAEEPVAAAVPPNETSSSLKLRIGLGLDTNLPLSTIRQSVELDSPVVDRGEFGQDPSQPGQVDFGAQSEDRQHELSVLATSAPTAYSFLAEEPTPMLMTKAQRRKSSLATLGLWSAASLPPAQLAELSMLSSPSAAMPSEVQQQRDPSAS